MAAFAHRLLPRTAEDTTPVAIRLLSGPQSRPLPAPHSMREIQTAIIPSGMRDWSLQHLAQFRHKHRPLAKAVDYAKLFIYDEAQQEAALSDIAILGALPQVSSLAPRRSPGGTGPGRLAQEVRAVSDGLYLGIRSARCLCQCRPLVPELCHICFTPAGLMPGA